MKLMKIFNDREIELVYNHFKITTQIQKAILNIILVDYYADEEDLKYQHFMETYQSEGVDSLTRALVLHGCQSDVSGVLNILFCNTGFFCKDGKSFQIELDDYMNQVFKLYKEGEKDA